MTCDWCLSNSQFFAFAGNPPYLTAVVCEILRLATITKFGVCRRSSESFRVGDKRIAKNCLVIANLHAIHRGLRTWKDPKNFRPERFLQDDSLIIPPNLVPFSIGKPACHPFRSESLTFNFFCLEKNRAGEETVKCGALLSQAFVIDDVLELHE